jgi:hypothetical protein
LFQTYLQDQVQAHAEGLGTSLPEEMVTPHEDSPIRPLDARPAWQDACAVVGLFPGVAAPTAWDIPPEWSALLHTLESATDVPLSLGNFPQRVRSLALLIRRQPVPVTPASERPELLAWARTQSSPLPRLLAAGLLRLVGMFDEAANLLALPVPMELAALHANEQAALTWQRGDHRAALASWLKQADSPAVRFNRGMAYLFLGERPLAQTELDAVCAALPESGSWHHLASLYRTLAEME